MRLPPFLTEKPLIGAVLDASDAGAALLEADVDRRNDQLSYRTADEGLRRWERDLSLPSDGDLPTRRARVYAALTGGRTLTVEELEKLALTLSDAQEAVVTEKYSRYQVILSALFDGEAGDLTALRAAVERRKPAHLDIMVQSTLPEKRVVYYGLATPLSVARKKGNGVSTGNFALYGGGLSADERTYYDTVDAYDGQLVRTTPQPLMTRACEVGSAMAGEVAIFAGGETSLSHDEASATAYSQDLTRSAIPQFSAGWFSCGGAVSNGRCAVFGSGETKYPSYYITDTVKAIDEMLTVTYPIKFTSARRYYAAANAGGTVLFAGGLVGASLDGSYSGSVEAYGPDLEKLSANALPIAVSLHGAAEAGNYAVFCGGYDGSSSRNMACAYSPELTRVILDNLSEARSQFHSVAFYNNALFSSGNVASEYASDCYSDDLTHTILPSISDARMTNMTNSRSASVGDYALMCGGLKASDYVQTSDTVDVFTVE